MALPNHPRRLSDIEPVLWTREFAMSPVDPNRDIVHVAEDIARNGDEIAGAADNIASETDNAVVATKHTVEAGGENVPRKLYRRESRSADQIFEAEFQPKGDNLELAEHVNYNPSDSGFVSTSKTTGGTTKAAGPEAISLRSEIRDPRHGIDVNEVIPDNFFYTAVPTT
jgi:hypothetical protein